MNTPLNFSDETPKEPGELVFSGPSEEASEIAENLIFAFAGSLEDKELSSFELVQCLTEFLVSTVRTIETISRGNPPNFRKILMRNIELNFDYKDGKDQGIDLSDLLIMGIKEEFEEDLEDN